MRKIYLLHLAAIALICSFIGTSCKKPVHANNPTPNNSRLLSYTKITEITGSATANVTSTVNENYRFFYDDLNRVVNILFTSNDSFNIHKGMAFRYSNDSVYKTTTNLINNDTVEIDTFVYNSSGQLTTAFTPALMTHFQYYGKLLANYTMTAHNDSGTTISASYSYTSDNGDFLAHLFDGNLNATLPSNRATPFHTTWSQYFPTSIPGVVLFVTPTTHTPGGYTDVLANYNEAPVLFTSSDYYGVTDTLSFPGALWRKESYHFYTEMANRPGDYLQIQSFTMYGYNIYQNSHLVESISSPNRHANIAYSVDAFSNITQAKVINVDSVLNNYTYTYNYQYETF